MHAILGHVELPCRHRYVQVSKRVGQTAPSISKSELQKTTSDMPTCCLHLGFSHRRRCRSLIVFLRATPMEAISLWLQQSLCLCSWRAGVLQAVHRKQVMEPLCRMRTTSSPWTRLCEHFLSDRAATLLGSQPLARLETFRSRVGVRIGCQVRSWDRRSLHRGKAWMDCRQLRQPAGCPQRRR